MLIVNAKMKVHIATVFTSATGGSHPDKFLTSNTMYESASSTIPIRSRTCQCQSVHKQYPIPYQSPIPTQLPRVTNKVTRFHFRVRFGIQPNTLNKINAVCTIKNRTLSTSYTLLVYDDCLFLSNLGLGSGVFHYLHPQRRSNLLDHRHLQIERPRIGFVGFEVVPNQMQDFRREFSVNETSKFSKNFSRMKKVVVPSFAQPVSPCPLKRLRKANAVVRRSQGFHGTRSTIAEQLSWLPLRKAASTSSRAALRTGSDCKMRYILSSATFSLTPSLTSTIVSFD